MSKTVHVLGGSINHYDENNRLKTYDGVDSYESHRTGSYIIDGSSVEIGSVLTNEMVLKATGNIKLDPVGDCLTIAPENTIYIGKHGDDAWRGRTPMEAVRTFAQAMTLVSYPNILSVVCLDAGTYTEDFTIPGYTRVMASSASLVGNVSANQFSKLECLSLGCGTGYAYSTLGGVNCYHYFTAKNFYINGTANGIYVSVAGGILNGSVDYLATTGTGWMVSTITGGYRTNLEFRDATHASTGPFVYMPDNSGRVSIEGCSLQNTGTAGPIFYSDAVVGSPAAFISVSHLNSVYLSDITNTASCSVVSCNVVGACAETGANNVTILSGSYIDHVASISNITDLEVTNLKLNGTCDANTQIITGLPLPTASSEPATKGYVDGLLAGLNWKDACELATIAALAANTYAGGPQTKTANANGALAVDGVAVLVGYRILVKNEGVNTENGIYDVTQVGDGGNPFILTRSADNNASVEIPATTAYILLGGTINNTCWVMSNGTFAVLDADPITFCQMSGGSMPLTTKGDIMLHNGVNAVRYGVGSDDQVLMADSGEANGVKWATLTPFAGPVTLFERQPATTEGGASTTGAWLTRTINQTNGNIALLAAGPIANEFSLYAGTYYVEASAPGYKCDGHICRLYNVDDAATEIDGSSGRSDDGSFDNNYSFIKGTFTIVNTKKLRLEHKFERAEGTNGMGRSADVGSYEIYSQITVWKVA